MTITCTNIAQTKPKRTPQLRAWRSLALGAAVTLVAAPSLAGSGFASGGVDASSAVDIARDMGAQLWTVQAEGGEAGEAGLIEGATDDAAYLAQLTIVEGHLIAAAALFANGQTDAAIELSNHPEAEMMDDMRAQLAIHKATDFTPLMKAFSAAMESSAPIDAVNAALADFRSSVAMAKADEAAELKARVEALVVVVKAAAEEYAGSIEGGVVTNVMAFHEAHAFLTLAREEAANLQTQELTEAASGRILEALTASDEAFGDLAVLQPVAQDPAILHAVAARVELIGASVR